MFLKWLQSVFVSIVLFALFIGLGIWLDPDNGVIYFGTGLTFGMLWLCVVTVFYMVMFNIKVFTGKDQS